MEACRDAILDQERERELPFCTCGLQVRHSGFRFKLPLVEGMGKTDALLVLRLGSGAQVFFNDRELASQLVKALSARAGEVRWEQKPLEMKDPGEHREDCQGSRSRQELRVCGHSNRLHRSNSPHRQEQGGRC